MKSHRRCVFQLKEKCKWTTRSSLEQAGVRIEQDVRHILDDKIFLTKACGLSMVIRVAYLVI